MPRNAQLALARLFRSYSGFLADPNVDALFLWLEAMHSAQDRVGDPLRDQLLAIPEFLALKAIRNHFHHGNEVAHHVKVVPAARYDLVTDLVVLCLVKRTEVEAAVAGIGDRWRDAQRPQIEAVLKWYGPVVNINPAVFNFMVKVALAVEGEPQAPIDEPAYQQLADAIADERTQGVGHFVTGDIGCRAGDVEGVFREIAHAEGLE